jgi:hypothetical protein
MQILRAAMLPSASSANSHYARIVRPERSELRKFRGVQNSCENFQTVHNASTGTGEICTGIYDVHLATSRSGKRIETGKSPEQFVIASRSIDIVSAKRHYDNLWTRI